MIKKNKNYINLECFKSFLTGAFFSKQAKCEGSCFEYYIHYKQNLKQVIDKQTR